MVTERRRLGELLLDAGVLSSEQLSRALEIQAQDGRRLGSILLAYDFVAEPQLVQALSRQLSIPWVSLWHVDVPDELLDLVPYEIARECWVVPVYIRTERRIGSRLYVAMDDPTNDEALQKVSETAGMPVKAMVAGPSDIASAIKEFYGMPMSSPDVQAPPTVPEKTEPSLEAPQEEQDTPPPPADSALEQVDEDAFDPEKLPEPVIELPDVLDGDLPTLETEVPSDQPLDPDADETAEAASPEAVVTLEEALVVDVGGDHPSLQADDQEPLEIVVTQPDGDESEENEPPTEKALEDENSGTVEEPPDGPTDGDVELPQDEIADESTTETSPEVDVDEAVREGDDEEPPVEEVADELAPEESVEEPAPEESAEEPSLEDSADELPDEDLTADAEDEELAVDEEAEEQPEEESATDDDSDSSSARPYRRRPSPIPDRAAGRRPRAAALTFLDGTTIDLSGRSAGGDRIKSVPELVGLLRAAGRGLPQNKPLPSLRWETYVADLIDLLLRKGVVTEQEILENLLKYD